jgi:hypothetical protein
MKLRALNAKPSNAWVVDEKEFKNLPVPEKAAFLVKEYPADKLIRPDLGELSLEGARSNIEALSELVREVSELNYAYLPASAEGTINGTLFDIYKTCKTLMGFSSSGNYSGPTVQYRDRLVQELDTNLNTWFPGLAPLVAYGRNTGTGRLDHEREQLNTSIGWVNHQLSTSLGEAKTRLTELEEIVSAARDAAGSVAVSETAQFFARESQDYGRGRKTWLVATLILAVTVAALVWYSYTNFTAALPELTTAGSIQLAFAKIAVFSVAYYVLLLFGRNFFAASHNEAINKRKATALQTFRAFVQATSDEATKDAVLRTTTEAIFAADSSGYLFRESERSGSGNTSILEVLRLGGHHGS